ncbi:MAG: cation-translocating P-type ATPase [Candidatus Thorarchaeota archaeon]
MDEHNGQYCRHCAEEESRAEVREPRSVFAVAIVGFVLMLLGVLLELSLLSDQALIVYGTSILVAGRYTIPRGIRGALHLHLDISFLMTAASFAAVTIGAPAEGAAVMVLYSVAEALEEYAGSAVEREVTSLANIRNREVSVLSHKGEVRLSPDRVPIKSRLVVRPGETIGLDGIVVSGVASVDESSITGESLPVRKNVGDKVLAGTIDLDGYLEIETTATYSDSTLSRIVELVESARKSRGKVESAVLRFSHVYTPLVVTGSVLLALSMLIVGTDPYLSVYRGLTLLVTACPCALVISVPVSMASSIAGAAREGVLIKGARHIESLAAAKTVAFDKTGTLTTGDFRVIHVCSSRGENVQTLLQKAAALSSRSKHPVSRAIVREAEQRNLRVIDDVTDFEYEPGVGVRGRVGGETFTITSAGTDDPTDHTCRPSDQDNTPLVDLIVGDERGELGRVVLADSLKQEAKETIRLLRNMDIDSIMLTGDSVSNSAWAAQELGLRFRAGLMPEDKVAAMRELSRDQTVAMVGDGVNDAPALASATVGIAVGASSSDAALETADVALMRNDLRGVVSAIMRAKRTMAIVKQNVILALTVKSLVIVLAVLGLSSLWIAVGVGDMGVTLVVTANALRLLRRGKQPVS